MAVRSDKLKKLESELADLENWLKLGLVPKKDIDKHEAEIAALRKKIGEESDKLQFLKETGETEEYVTPRKQAPRTQYTEAPTMPDMEAEGEAVTLTEVTSETRGETVADSLFEDITEEDETVSDTTEEDDPFSDKNRWKRGMLHGEDEEW